MPIPPEDRLDTMKTPPPEAGRLTSLCGQLTSEPALFVYSFAIGVYASIVPNLILQKICNPGGPPPLDHVCNETGAIVEAAGITTLRNGLRELVPVLVLLVAGSWRDATGRNSPLMWLPLVGEVVGVSVELLGVWDWAMSPRITSVVASVLYGLSGGSKLFYVGATCAITDGSSPEDRTTRMAIYQAAAYTGSCLSSAASGFCLKYLGYQWLFLFVISLHLLSIALVLGVVKDNRKEKQDGGWGMFDKMKAVCRSRPNNPVIWLMLISCVIINVSAGGETNLYLYYLQQVFGFTVVEAGVYISFRLMFGIISTTVLSPIFSNLLKWSDFRIGIISSAVTLVSSISMIFARTLLQLILFALLDFLKILVYTLPMSMLTKYVKSDEVGVFVSLRFVGGCILPIFVYYIYDWIFAATSHTWPGAFFFASAIITFIVLLSFCICPLIYVEPETELPENKNAKENEGYVIDAEAELTSFNESKQIV